MYVGIGYSFNSIQFYSQRREESVPALTTSEKASNENTTANKNTLRNGQKHKYDKDSARKNNSGYRPKDFLESKGFGEDVLWVGI